MVAATMKTCLGKLTDEQIWSRGGPHENAVGNIVLHLCGNIRQWAIHGVGDAKDVRVREAVNAHPELQYRLHEIGITMFDEAGFIAPSMTFGALALAVGRRPWDLLAELGRTPPAAATDPALGQAQRAASR